MRTNLVTPKISTNEEIEKARGELHEALLPASKFKKYFYLEEVDAHVRKHAGFPD